MRARRFSGLLVLLGYRALPCEELAKQFLPIRQVTADSAAIVGRALRFATKPSDLWAPWGCAPVLANDRLARHEQKPKQREDILDWSKRGDILREL
jgi:hypothetical protein